MAKVDREAFEQVAKELEGGAELTLEHIGRVFSNEFWMMIVMLFLDAQDSARAIAGAMNRLRGGEDAN